MTRFSTVAVFVLWTGMAGAAVRMPGVFASNMVVQQQMKAPFWGWADPGERITVEASWGAESSATAGDDGSWRVALQTPEAGGPFAITVRGTNTLEFQNVLSGEVWLCSGQSNMGMAVGSSNNAKEEIAAGDYPDIRLMWVKLIPSAEPKDDCKVRPWEPCSPKNVGGFTAAGYFFGRKLYRELKVPIGLINSSWGGTCIEAWTPWESQKDDPVVQGIKASWDKRDEAYDAEKAKAKYETDLATYREWVKNGKQGKALRYPRKPVQPREDRNHPANLYNGMIHPLGSFGVRGAIWYQGEANAGRGAHYRVQLERLITSWRRQWGYEFPFYFVQLPNFRKPWQAPVEDHAWAFIRESFMNAAKEVPNTGMAITIDIGDEKNIHPKNKQDVGDRLGRLALHKTYGRTGFSWSGPVFESCEFRNGKAIVTFDTGGSPLASRNGEELFGFALTGVNGVAVRATAKIVGDQTLEASSPEVPEPVMVHYAWAANPVGANLVNADGLPASPFRFGSIPEMDTFARNLPEEAERYKLVYAFDPTRARLTDGNTVFVYEEDRSGDIAGPFRKVAYYLALQDRAGDVTYAFVSIDAFTDDIEKIGVPAKATGARFQQKVTGAVVKSNAEGVTSGEFPEGCNIEFWDCNYGPQNSAAVPNAKADVWDFGDSPGGDKSPGYGCMQIHNWKEKQSIICFNRFGSGKNNDVGIGNSTGKTRDWTFTSSAKEYARGEFKIFVLP